MQSRPDELISAAQVELGTQDSDLAYLVDGLQKLRLRIHPDKIQDPQARAEAEERLKRVNPLIDSLHALLERSVAIEPFRSDRPRVDFEKLQLQADLYEMVARLKAAQIEVEYLKGRVDSLTVRQNSENRKKLVRLTRRLVQVDRRTPAQTTVAGISSATAVIGFLSTLVPKVEELLLAVGGQGVLAFRIALLVLAAIASVVFARNLSRSSLRYRLSELVRTAAFAKQFVSTLKSESEDGVTFNEADVAEYIGLWIKEKRPRWQWAFDEVGIELVKNIFVSYLLERSVVQPGHAAGLQRVFVVKQKSKYGVGLDWDFGLDLSDATEDKKDDEIDTDAA